jgi:large subunit ribosomal protein L10
MARPEKEAMVESIRGKLERARASVLTDYRGLNVQEMTQLRKQLTQAGVEYRVLKNTLTSRAAKEANIQGLDRYLEGPLAIAFGYDDPVAPAKVIFAFTKDHKNLEVKGGILEGKIIDAEGVKALADLPGREQLLAMVLRAVQGPLYGLANALQGNIRNLAYAIDAVRRMKEEQSA